MKTTFENLVDDFKGYFAVKFGYDPDYNPATDECRDIFEDTCYIMWMEFHLT